MVMSSEVETSLNVKKESRNSKRFLGPSSPSRRLLQAGGRTGISTRDDREDDTTQNLFASLNVYHDDDSSRSAALNMAIDEALLENATRPLIRFYCWKRPALSFGYFGQFADVEIYAAERDLVRRWTGGGIVFHGDDLTYSIIIPATDRSCGESSMSIYEKVHRALRDVLAEKGERAIVAAVADRGDAGPATRAAVNAHGQNCFANPVRADVLVDGRKVAGAAQRRTRAGLLHQGSIQDVDLGKDFTERFAQELSRKWTARNLDQTIFNRAQEIGQQKYGNQTWLRRR